MKVKGLNTTPATGVKAEVELNDTAVSYFRTSTGAYQSVIIRFDGISKVVGSIELVGNPTTHRDEAILELKKGLVNSGLV
jgi:hypothetical protein